jgi:hypothetical protein
MPGIHAEGIARRPRTYPGSPTSVTRSDVIGKNHVIDAVEDCEKFVADWGDPLRVEDLLLLPDGR